MNETPRQYSQLRSDQRTPLRERLPLDAPLSLFLDPSNRCNFHCSFCPRALSDYRNFVPEDVHLDFELCSKVFRELHGWTRLKVLRLYYLGEPFLNPRFVDILELALRLRIAERIEITSNASVLSKELSERFCNAAGNTADIDVYLRFSIYSVLPERHAKITGSSFDIDRIRRNIETLKSVRDAAGCRNVHLYAKMLDTFTDENDLFLERYRSIVDETAIESPHNWSGFDGNDVLADAYGTDVSPAHPRRHDACPLLFYSMAVNADGSVVVCCIDWSRKTLLGNVNTQSLQEIWNGEPLRNLRLLHLAKNRHANEGCRNCEFLHEIPEVDNVDLISPEEWIGMEKEAGVEDAGAEDAGVPAK